MIIILPNFDGLFSVTSQKGGDESVVVFPSWMTVMSRVCVCPTLFDFLHYVANTRKKSPDNHIVIFFLVGFPNSSLTLSL